MEIEEAATNGRQTHGQRHRKCWNEIIIIMKNACPMHIYNAHTHTLDTYSDYKWEEKPFFNVFLRLFQYKTKLKRTEKTNLYHWIVMVCIEKHDDKSQSPRTCNFSPFVTIIHSITMPDKWKYERFSPSASTVLL